MEDRRTHRPLADRQIVVTGASRGIGRAVAERLAGDGARLVLVARDAGALEGVLAGLQGAGHASAAVDVADEDAWPQVTGALGGRPLHGLVCAAAIAGPVGRIGDYAPREFRRTVEVDLLGTYLAVHHCLEALRAGQGRVITFGGGGSLRALPGLDAYAAAKAAVLRLTENLAAGLAPEGLRAFCVLPTFTPTGIHDAVLEAPPDAAGAELRQRVEAALERGTSGLSDTVETVRSLLVEAEVPQETVVHVGDGAGPPPRRRRRGLLPGRRR